MSAAPFTLDDVPGWLREHGRANGIRVLFYLADELDAALCDRADVEAEAWNTGATAVPMPAMPDAMAELFRAGAFAMLASIDHARAEAEAGNAFAAGYLAELTGGPEHDYEHPPARPAAAPETVADMHRRTIAVSSGEAPAPAGVPTTFIIDPLNDLDAWVPADTDPTPAHGTERPAEADENPSRGLGRVLGHMLTTMVPERPRCPHCGDRFRTHGELSTHVRDTGELSVRPAHSCPVLWRRRRGE